MFDFEFITQAFGLLPIQNNTAAINAGAILDMKKLEAGGWMIRIERDIIYTLSDDEMAELERNIKARADAVRISQKEAIKANIKLQAEAEAELSGAIASTPAVIVGTVPAGRRFRQ